ncbi:MAG TPA: polymer-forming cytoskeletal protein [Thermoanaerobaculia bacterium]|nr:polymer-forming cytoskeletal protein [Thermoanaerobaculia bacterium]
MRRLNRALLPAGGLAALAMIVLAMVMAPAGAFGKLMASETTPPGRMSVARSLHVSSPVSGDVELIGGSVIVDSAVDGNVVVFGGNVELRPGASVTGDVISVGGRITAAEGSRVGGRMVSPGSLAGAVELASRGGSTLTEHGSSRTLFGAAVSLSLLLIWLVVSVLVTLGASKDIRSTSSELVASPFYSFVIGLIALTSFILTAIVFSYLVPYLVGIPLLAALGLFALLTKIYGMVAVFHAVGTMLTRPRHRNDLGRRRWIRGDLAMVIVGLVILGVIRMIPLVGAAIWMGASIFGTGVALATRFGKREPWFLEWRSTAQVDL